MAKLKKEVNQQKTTLFLNNYKNEERHPALKNNPNRDEEGFAQFESGIQVEGIFQQASIWMDEYIWDAIQEAVDSKKSEEGENFKVPIFRLTTENKWVKEAPQGEEGVPF